MKTAILLISCPDQRGIVAKVSNTLFYNNCNIVHSDQHSTDPANGHFFMRLHFTFNSKELDKVALESRITELCKELDAKWELYYGDQKMKVGILVSKQDHCLYELLYRYQNGDLNMEIPFVISNHNDLKDLVESNGIKFYHIPITKENKAQQEEKILEISQGTDTLILARYMQILTSDFLNKYGKRVINIHHSFLPSFKGANPYKQAFERGVKIIGATAHYVTKDLDEGPIISQQVTPVTHKDDVQTLTRKGKDIEKMVLAQALHAQLENRIICYQNKTIVFD